MYYDLKYQEGKKPNKSIIDMFIAFEKFYNIHERVLLIGTGSGRIVFVEFLGKP